MRPVTVASQSVLAENVSPADDRHGSGARDIRRTQVALDPEHDPTHLIIISNLPAAQKSVDASVRQRYLRQGFTNKWAGYLLCAPGTAEVSAYIKTGPVSGQRYRCWRRLIYGCTATSAAIKELEATMAATATPASKNSASPDSSSPVSAGYIVRFSILSYRVLATGNIPCPQY